MADVLKQALSLDICSKDEYTITKRPKRRPQASELCLREGEKAAGNCRLLKFKVLSGRAPGERARVHALPGFVLARIRAGSPEGEEQPLLLSAPCGSGDERVFCKTKLFLHLID